MINPMIIPEKSSNRGFDLKNSGKYSFMKEDTRVLLSYHRKNKGYYSIKILTVIFYNDLYKKILKQHNPRPKRFYFYSRHYLLPHQLALIFPRHYLS